MANINTTTQNNHQKEQRDALQEQRVVWQEQYDVLKHAILDLGFADLLIDQLHDDVYVESLLTRQDSVKMVDDSSFSELLKLREQYLLLMEERRELWPEECAIEDLNKKHAIIHIDQTYILTEKHDFLGFPTFTIESKGSFKMFYEDQVVQCADGDHRSVANVWLKSPNKKKYTAMTFNPDVSGHISGAYNLWRGFARDAKKGSCERYWQHVRENICASNNDYYIYIRKWLAYVFQYPAHVHTALVLIGSQGVGKNSFVDPLGVLLGSHYILLSSINELVSHFNSHLKDKVLIHANESFWGGHKKEVGMLKAMVTDSSFLIESKGRDRIRVPNFRHLIISSNEDWPVHVDHDDRRFFVVQVSERHKEDHEYFAAIKCELEDGGYEALLYDLLHEDLSEFNPRIFPQNKEIFDLKMRSSSSIARYIYYALIVGCFDSERMDSIWPDEIRIDELYRCYTVWCMAEGEDKLGNNQFGAFLRKCIPTIKKRRASTGKRPWCYLLPELENARKDFCKSFKAKYVDIFAENDEQESLQP